MSRPPGLTPHVGHMNGHYGPVMGHKRCSIWDESYCIKPQRLFNHFTCESPHLKCSEVGQGGASRTCVCAVSAREGEKRRSQAKESCFLFCHLSPAGRCQLREAQAGRRWRSNTPITWRGRYPKNPMERLVSWRGTFCGKVEVLVSICQICERYF